MAKMPIFGQRSSWWQSSSGWTKQLGAHEWLNHAPMLRLRMPHATKWTRRCLRWFAGREAWLNRHASPRSFGWPVAEQTGLTSTLAASPGLLLLVTRADKRLPGKQGKVAIQFCARRVPTRQAPAQGSRSCPSPRLGAAPGQKCTRRPALQPWPPALVPLGCGTRMGAPYTSEHGHPGHVCQLGPGMLACVAGAWRGRHQQCRPLAAIQMPARFF